MVIFKPHVLFISCEPSISRMIQEVLKLEGYPQPMDCVQTGDAAMAYLHQHPERFIVIMDNYHLYPDVQAFARQVFADPVLHARIKTVGLTVQARRGSIPLDAWLELPLNVEDLLAVCR